MLDFTAEALKELVAAIPRINPADAAAMIELASHLVEGVRIELPTNGIPFGGDWRKGYQWVDHTSMTLPFPTTILEYPYELFLGQPGMSPAGKRIAVWLDYHTHKDTLIGQMALKVYPPVGEAGGVMLAPIYHMNGKWLPWGIGLVIPRVSPKKPVFHLFTYSTTEDNGNPSKFGVAPVPILPTMGDFALAAFGDDAKKTVVKDCAEEVHVLVGLLSELKCGALLEQHGEVYTVV